MPRPSPSAPPAIAIFVLLLTTPIGARQEPAPAGTAAAEVPADVTETIAPHGGLSLRVFAVPYKGAGPGASVLVGTEILGLAGRGLGTERLEVRVEASDTVWSLSMPLADVPAALAAHGVRVLTRVSLPPGRHLLRITAREDGSGRSGASIHTLDVEDLTSADAIRVSGLTLTSSSTDGFTWADPAEEHRVLPILLRPPTTQRTFSASDRVEVHAEIYDWPATFEDEYLSLTISTRVRRADGSVAYTTEDVGTSEILTSGHYGYAHSAAVPLRDLSPGRYTLEVEARTTGSSQPAVRREVPFGVAGGARLR